MYARTLGATIALGVCAFASHARADAASDAKDLFDRAREMRASGDCAGALPLFHKAFDIYPNALGSLRNAAECEESVGHWASARRSWLDLKRAVMLVHDKKYEGWDSDADSAARRLASRVSHLTVDVSTGDHGNEGLEVTLNGETLPTTLVGTTLDRDPGKYVVRAHNGAGEPAEQTVEIVTGESRTVRLVVAPAGQPLPPQPKPVRHQGISSWTVAGAVTTSLGVLALAGMGVALGVRQDALTQFTALCPNYQTGVCPTSAKDAHDRGATASDVVTALAIAGSIVSGAGVVMLVMSAASSSHREHVALHLSPVGAMLEGTF